MARCSCGNEIYDGSYRCSSCIADSNPYGNGSEKYTRDYLGHIRSDIEYERRRKEELEEAFRNRM